MEENQNTNEQGQPKEVTVIKAQELSEPLIKETPTPSTTETKEEAPILSTQPRTINHKQETAEMEVHKHPHHVMHKKKWSEYLLEFFMLFLAAFWVLLLKTLGNVLWKKKERSTMRLKTF